MFRKASTMQVTSWSIDFVGNFFYGKLFRIMKALTILRQLRNAGRLLHTSRSFKVLIVNLFMFLSFKFHYINYCAPHFQSLQAKIFVNVYLLSKFDYKPFESAPKLNILIWNYCRSFRLSADVEKHYFSFRAIINHDSYRRCSNCFENLASEVCALVFIRTTTSPAMKQRKCINQRHWM